MIQRLLCQRLPHRGSVTPSSSLSPQSRGAESTTSCLVFIFQIFACKRALPRAGRPGQAVRLKARGSGMHSHPRPLAPGLGNKRFHLPDQTKVQAKAEERATRN